MNKEQQVKQAFEVISDAIERGCNVRDACVSAGVSPSFYYYWRNRFANRGVFEDGDAPPSLIEENRKLRRLLAEQVLENSVLRDKYGVESAGTGGWKIVSQADMSSKR